MKPGDYKLLKENWDNFVNEEEVPALFNEDGSIQEEEVLNEIALMAAGATALAKLFAMMYMALQNKKDLDQISQNLQDNENLPVEVRNALVHVDKALAAVEDAAPALSKLAETTGTKWNPLNWKANVILALVKKFTEPKGKEEEGAPIGQSIGTGAESETGEWLRSTLPREVS